MRQENGCTAQSANETAKDWGRRLWLDMFRLIFIPPALTLAG
jgi:hypothetical protein